VRLAYNRVVRLAYNYDVTTYPTRFARVLGLNVVAAVQVGVNLSRTYRDLVPTDEIVLIELALIEID
jgi:hypothetical protein